MRTYTTTYCNFAHVVESGKPVGHACIVIPPTALAAEIAGDTLRAIELLDAAQREGRVQTMRRGVRVRESYAFTTIIIRDAFGDYHAGLYAREVQAETMAWIAAKGLELAETVGCEGGERVKIGTHPERDVGLARLRPEQAAWLGYRTVEGES